MSLALLPRLTPFLTSPTVPLPGSRLRSSPIIYDPIFLPSGQRPCVPEPQPTFPSFSEPRTMRSFTRPFCFPFSLAEFPVAACNLFSSATTGPDKVAYSMLRHLPRSGMDFLLHIFNLSLFLHSFTSIWKTSTIIPIHKMGKPLDYPASFRLNSLTSCVSKFFERIILSRPLFFLESNPILFPRHAGFRPGRSTFDQILFLSQSIFSVQTLTNEFNKF